LFARLTLADDEFALYQQILEQLRPRTPTPDLVIYLQAPTETLIERVHRRGNPIESGISESYLRALSEAYARFFHQYDEAPVLIVNAEHLNPIERDADFGLLLERIDRLRGRREYFNLAA
jgi:deoxyguanosine kinase